MRFQSSTFLLVLLTGLLALSPPAAFLESLLAQRTPAEELASEWDSLARRQIPFQIVKGNEFDLTGAPVSKTAISKDGSTLLVLDQEGAFAFWNLKTGKLTARVVPDQASPDACIDITHNGKLAVIGFPSGLIQVYFATIDQPTVQYDAFKSPVTMVQFSSDQNRIIAVDEFGKSLEVDMKGNSKGFQFGPAEDTPIRSWVAAGDKQETWWKIYVDDDNKVSDIFFDGQQKRANNLELVQPRYIESADDRYLLVSPKQLVWVSLKNLQDGKPEATFKKLDLDTPLHDARYFFRRGLMLTLTDQKLEMRDAASGRVVREMDLPDDLQPEHTRVLPNAEALVTITPQGHVTSWNAFLSPNSSIARLSASMAEAYRNKRFDAFELIAQKWNARTDHFENREHETPYTFLMQTVQRRTIRVQGLGIEPYQDLHNWIDKHPDNCQFTRIALFRLYLAYGYRARGSGFADSVTDEAWKTFYENMEKSWEVAAPLFDQENIPAEAYTCAIIAGKNLQWDREVVNEYLREAFAKYPNYHRTFAEEAVARLPRWGGKPGETEYLARFTADKLGGVEGDILYAQIARHVAKFVGWDNIDIDTRFSRERIIKGMLAITKDTEDSSIVQEALHLAARWDEEEAGMTAAKRMREVANPGRKSPLPDNPELLKKLYEQAKNR